jgi:murein DD-endopeptidase MepM/ murein hydrolase activator NlpD
MLNRTYGILLMLITFTLFGLVNPYSVNAEQSSMNKTISKWDWPVPGMVTDHFGSRGGSHYGIDIAAESGTEIQSVEYGVVHKSYYSNTYGHVIFIQHPGDVETVYAHLSKRLVEEGDKVEKGKVIGLVGSTGRSDGNHLHFEVHHTEWNIDKSNAVDPFVFLHQDKSHENNALEASKTEHMEDERVTVQKGDTLWGLSKTYGVTIQDLKEWNELNSDIIYAGNSLIVFKEKA